MYAALKHVSQLGFLIGDTWKCKLHNEYASIKLVIAILSANSSRRESTSLTSSGSYWDSSTWTYVEFEPKNSEDNCKTSYTERLALNTHTGHSGR